MFLTLKTKLLVTILVIIGGINAQRCYKRCNCLKSKSAQKAAMCNKNITYLNILVDEKGIGISCRQLFPEDIKDTVIFDAKYLTYINEESPIPLESIVKKCQKSKQRNIQYDLNMLQFDNITISSSIFETNPHISHLNIRSNVNSNNTKNFFKLDADFLKNASHLKVLTIKNNNLMYMDSIFKESSSIEILDLSSNRLENFRANLFAGFEDLKSLILQQNQITFLNKEMLNGLENITYIDLSQNKINKIERNAFDDFSNLEYLNISANNLYILPNDLFSVSINIKYLDLAMNENLLLPENIFSPLESLTSLNLSNTNLKEISKDFLQTNTDLQVLNLSKNSISELKTDAFTNLYNLTLLDLSYNKLQYLPNTVFSNLGKIRKIYLNDNRLTKIGVNIFSHLNYLEIIDLSGNLIVDIKESDEHVKCNEVILKNNLLSRFPAFLIYNASISNLDLSRNLIDEFVLVKDLVPDKSEMKINLSNNSLRHVDIRGGNTTSRNWKLDLDISKNYVKCDCEKFSLTKDNKKAFSALQLTYNQSFCRDKSWKQRCPLVKIRNCPTPCDCYYQDKKLAVVVDCSVRNLTRYPVVHNVETVDNQFKQNQTVVYLSGNRLNLEGQINLESYANVSILDLSHNEITKVNWIPQHVKVLHLEDNKLSTLSDNVITTLRNDVYLNRVSLGNNSWICDSTAKKLQKFLIEFNNIKVDQSEVICNKTGESLVYMKLYDQQTNAVMMIFLISVTIALALISILTMLYYKYNKSIKIYLYSKNLCLWCVAEDELDKGKDYDIFISYSNKDEEFVQNRLLKELEQGEIPFKVCIHYRDWMPGEFISKQIINSVLNSRRTLVILSNNFLESVWGKMEFRTAHTQAISEGRARVIVVIYGELNEDSLDEEMQTYLKTNTYVKWGDPWFWNKLKYALPHSKARTLSRGNWYKHNHPVN
ncbi:protein toll-like [Sitophilus oryzae]|uniref:Protein toll-like n=1 Tax=Sitophilus oryzae TaxID=7048 RepID=A0A6J2YBW5_SITOR|nr:protein toll-like [Sitophilus oryzae]